MCYMQKLQYDIHVGVNNRELDIYKPNFSIYGKNG